MLTGHGKNSYTGLKLMRYMPDVFKRIKSSSKNNVASSFCLLGICLVFAGCSTPTPVIKMSKVLPDIVKQYKTARVYGDRPGMYNMGVHVEEGDYFTFIGKGEIWYRSQRGRSSRPSGSDYRLLYRIGKEPPVDRYFGGTIFGGGMLKADRAGDLYLGFDDGGVYPNGEARYPQN